MRILVTGSAGQIGIDLITMLRGAGHDVISSDIVQDANTRRLDVTDSSEVLAIFRELQPEVVYHLAAVLSAKGEANPEQTYAVNQNGTLNVLEACRQVGVRQMIFTSSIAVYGPGAPEPAGDDAAQVPTTMYGVTKASCELLGQYYFQRFGLDFRGVRFPGLVSTAMPGGGSSDYALHMFFEVLKTGSYEAFCRPDTRIPFMYMPDAIRAMYELSEAPRQDLHRCIYNVAAFSPTAEEIAASIIKQIPTARITFAPDPSRQAILDSWPDVLDDSCARNDWNWRAQTDLDAMTADLIPKVRDMLAAQERAATPA